MWDQKFTLESILYNIKVLSSLTKSKFSNHAWALSLVKELKRLHGLKFKRFLIRSLAKGSLTRVR